MASGKVGRPGHHHAPRRQELPRRSVRERTGGQRGLRQLPAGGRILFWTGAIPASGLTYAGAACIRTGIGRPAEPERQPVALQQNTDRIQTTHIGSLPRPHDAARHHEGEAQQAALRRGGVSDDARQGRRRLRPQAGRVRHRHRHRRRILQARLLHLHPGTARGLRGAAEPEDDPVPEGGRGVSGILRRVFQAGDDGRHASSRSRRWCASGR